MADQYETFGFIIAGCIRSQEHMISLNSCISSIKQFNPEQKIVVVMDFTSNKDLENMVITINPSVIFEINTEQVPADMLLLKYFKEKKYFDKAIFIQDSMRIKNTIDVSNVLDIQYLWHFTNHRVHWSIIREPETEYNILNNIITHDDLNIHLINSIIKNTDFKEYCKKIYLNKEEWCGCFGLCSIITHNFILKLDEMTNITDIQMYMLTNRLRRSIESIFSLACQYVTKRKMENSYDGLYYDGINGNNLEGTSISKQTFDRQ